MVDQKHISVIVLFQELEIESVCDLSLQDLLQLGEPFLLGACVELRCEQCLDLGSVGLTLLFDNIEGNLESDKVLILLLGADQLLEQDGSALWKIKVELALGDLEVVSAIPESRLLGLIDL